jgi:hypothetical protein
MECPLSFPGAIMACFCWDEIAVVSNGVLCFYNGCDGKMGEQGQVTM